ncbi:hypothetical protein MferCBS31731_007686 [Microsporum ferrugineum]
MVNLETTTFIIPGLWERELNPDLPDDYFKPPTDTKADNVYVSKGVLIGIGGTAYLERPPSGEVIKTPIPDPDPRSFRENCRNMRLEAQVYEMLGDHPCMPKLLSWDPETCCIRMEYMPRGNLKEYMHQNQGKISDALRLRWGKQAAEGVDLLHSHDILHCDISPRDFLLDDNLDLKISDFGGVSVSGAEPTAAAGTRFRWPVMDWDIPPTIEDDIFSLGSLIYFIMIGVYPYKDTPSDEVEKLYMSKQFPDVRDILCGEIIIQCWQRQITAKAVFASLEYLGCQHNSGNTTSL